MTGGSGKQKARPVAARSLATGVVVKKVRGGLLIRDWRKR